MRGSIVKRILVGAFMFVGFTSTAFGTADIRLTQGASGAVASGDSCAAPTEFKTQPAMDDVTAVREAATTGGATGTRRTDGGAGKSGSGGASSSGSGVQ